MVRFIDILISITALFLLFPLMLFLLFLGFFDTGSPVFRQERVGRHKVPFTLFKFRTMKVNTDSTATHLVDSSAVTNFGRILRKTKLDELPQLFNVLIGDMSLVGPRPGLFSQTALTNARSELGVYDVKPGITGLGQVEGIDMSTPELLAIKDKELIDSLTVNSYFHYLFRTIRGDGQGDRINQQ